MNHNQPIPVVFPNGTPTSSQSFDEEGPDSLFSSCGYIMQSSPNLECSMLRNTKASSSSSSSSSSASSSGNGVSSSSTSSTDLHLSPDMNQPHSVILGRDEVSSGMCTMGLLGGAVIASSTDSKRHPPPPGTLNSPALSSASSTYLPTATESKLPVSAQTNLTYDVWRFVLSYLALPDLLPNASFFRWVKAKSALYHKSGIKMDPFPYTCSLHLVSRWMQYMVLVEIFDRCTPLAVNINCSASIAGSTVSGGSSTVSVSTGLPIEMNGLCLSLLNHMTVIPELHNLHIEAIVATHTACDHMNLKPTSKESIEPSYSKKYVLYQLILQKLLPLRSFRLRDIHSILPECLCTCPVAFELVMKGLISLRQNDCCSLYGGESYGCSSSSLSCCGGNGACVEVNKPKKWHCLDFTNRISEKEVIPTECIPLVAEVLLYARYSRFNLDDSLGPAVIAEVAHQLYVTCFTEFRMLRPLWISLHREQVQETTFLLEVLACIIENRLYTQLVIQTLRGGMNPVLAVLTRRRPPDIPVCWGNCRLNEAYYHQGDEIVIDPLLHVTFVEVLNTHINPPSSYRKARTSVSNASANTSPAQAV